MDAGELTRAFFDAFSRRDLDTMRSMLADRVDYRLPGMDKRMTTPDEVMATYERIVEANKDAGPQKLLDFVAGENLVAFTVTAPGEDEPVAAIIHEWNDDGKLLRYHGFANRRHPQAD